MEIALKESSTSTSTKLSTQAAALLKTLLYFDIFNYPLTSSELLEYCQGDTIDACEMAKSLEVLTQKNYIIKQGEFYFLSDREALIERRKNGNAEAEKKMKVAQYMSDFISKFPFVQSVSISGSLSKNYMDKESDIDFFIITTPHRLWLCRGILVAFKKIVLFNSRKHFCINYYLDSENLEIPDRNIFTATEIVFLKPTFNLELFKKFRASNDWCACYYPNKATVENSELINSKNGLMKKVLEKLLAGYLGEKLDSFFFKMTLNRWKKKFPHFNTEEFDLNLRSRKNVSKHHPRGYQKIVLESFQEKIRDFELRFNVKLH
ncbi:MAG: nucleotidyltransferase domain-containing protein [Bacteroidetes bacterium]|nr:nucleotidyltransferase domain-containing protein [Bacteroidota bacterium]